jgi:type II secretory pathway component PulK
LNVNTATEAELRRFLGALRIDGRRADRLAQAIADWKDVDVLHRARGAEVEAYIEAGAPFLPANAPFRDVRELRWVLGMTGDIYDRVVPFLTTVGSGRVNLRSADRAVMLALPGMTEEAVGWVLRLRRDTSRPLTIESVQQTLGSSARAVMLPHLPILATRTVSTTTEVEVRSVGWAEFGRVRVEVSALVTRAGGELITSARRVR